MPRFALLTAAFLLGAGATYLAVSVVELNVDRKPYAAMLVEMKTPVNQQLAARYVMDPDQLSALEGFFPNYRRRPTSNRTSGWTTSYRVYFSFAGGETVCVGVSFREAAQWSTGKGDFHVQGRFFDFADEQFHDRQGP